MLCFMKRFKHYVLFLTGKLANPDALNTLCASLVRVLIKSTCESLIVFCVTLPNSRPFIMCDLLLGFFALSHRY